MADDWNWWVGHSDDAFTTKCDTRDEAILIARTEYDGAYIVEATGPAVLRLSDQFDVHYFLERAEERIYDKHGDPDGQHITFDVPGNAFSGLQECVRSAIEHWQDRKGLEFNAWAFDDMRDLEYIDGDPTTSLSDDAIVVLVSMFPNGEKSMLAYGGVGSLRTATARAIAAFDELMQAGIITSFVDVTGRTHLTGVDAKHRVDAYHSIAERGEEPFSWAVNNGFVCFS